MSFTNIGLPYDPSFFLHTLQVAVSFSTQCLLLAHPRISMAALKASKTRVKVRALGKLRVQDKILVLDYICPGPLRCLTSPYNYQLPCCVRLERDSRH